MKRIPVTILKRHCLAILDRLDQEGIIITRRGKPVAKLLPMAPSSAHFIGAMKGRLKIRGDIMSTGIRWTAGGG